MKEYKLLYIEDEKETIFEGIAESALSLDALYKITHPSAKLCEVEESEVNLDNLQ